MQPETRFKIQVQKRLAKIPNLWVVKVQQVAIRGIPDMLICYKGFFFAFELKVGSNKASPLQQYSLDAITAAGGTARVVTPDNLEESITELLNAGHTT